MSSTLAYIVFGYAIFFGSTLDGALAKSFRGLFSYNEDPMEVQAAISKYEYLPGIGAHKVHSTLKTWNVARRACKDDGGHLLIINSKAEAIAASKLMSELDVQYAWVGVHDYFEESEYLTIYGETLVSAGFDEWVPGEPNNAGRSESCAVLTNTSMLMDMGCHRFFGSVCELPRMQSLAPEFISYDDDELSKIF